MPKKKKEFNNLTVSQLNTIENDLLNEQRKLRFDMVVSSIENPSRIKWVRKDIARIKTILREIELGKRQPKQL